MPVALVKLYNRFLDALSFGADYQKLRRLLNARIDSPESIEELPPSHPAGFVREMKKRRITIVESYLILIRSLESERHVERIHALNLLEEQAFHSKNITMPLNTARVQLALMKEAIKSRDNKRRQLELLHDFTVSSFGQPSVIRAYLDELGIIELPEKGGRLEDLDGGWDHHVHDNTSYGRKTPSQLVIDAFIKGLSEISVGFNLLNTGIGEVLSAGDILGVRVNIGAEFSVLLHGCRFHFMFLLPFIRRGDELARFFTEHAGELRFFIDGLNRNQESRITSIHALIDNFNSLHLPALNSGYPEGSPYFLARLDLASIDEIVPMESLNRMHLGELLYAQWKPVLLKRVLRAKSELNHARAELTRRSISEWDYTTIASRYQALRETYTGLNPEVLRGQYFSAPPLIEYPTVFSDVQAVCAPLRSAGGQIKILHPLEHGLEAARGVISANAQWIDFVEVYNMYDSINRSVDDILQFAHFINGLNGGQEKLARPIIPVCGSDSTGRSSTVPGMGFIFRSRIMGPRGRRFLSKHFALPEYVSRIIAARGSFVGEAAEPADAIISMGKTTHFTPNRIGDETDVAPIPLGRALRYLNPVPVNLLAVGAGFLVAAVTIGWEYALVWFGITSMRHVIVDLVARRGSRVREWSFREIDFRNIARSLFWTGVSVPLLAFVKAEFDLFWPFAPSGHSYQFAKFFFIAFVNGLYLFTHNLLRGFEKGVAGANFFRTIISWPFASLFAPVGDLFFIPSIVQSKLWSDVVGGLIEGSAKFIRSVGLTRRDLSDIIPLASADDEAVRFTAILDLLYIFGRETRARNSMREIFFGKRNMLERIGDFARGRKSNHERRDDEYRRLSAWLDRPGSYHALAEFVITRYSPEWALMLIELLERQYIRFRDWLGSESPRDARLNRRLRPRE